MGQIRASLVYANPRFELCGIIDVNLASAQVLDRYSVRGLVFQILSKHNAMINVSYF